MSTQDDRGSARALQIISTFLERAKKAHDGLVPETPLYGEGLGLDSLEAAELSALLEDALGSDPFSSGDAMPQTIGDVLAFYEVGSAA